MEDELSLSAEIIDSPVNRELKSHLRTVLNTHPKLKLIKDPASADEFLITSVRILLKALSEAGLSVTLLVGRDARFNLVDSSPRIQAAIESSSESLVKSQLVHVAVLVSGIEQDVVIDLASARLGSEYPPYKTLTLAQFNKEWVYTRTSDSPAYTNKILSDLLHPFKSQSAETLTSVSSDDLVLAFGDGVLRNRNKPASSI